MCDKENAATIKSVPDCYKNQEMCNKAVVNYPHALEFVPECHKTQEMCNKSINRCLFIFYSISYRYKTYEMCGRIVSEDLVVIVYCPDKYKTRRMCDKAVGLLQIKWLKNFILLYTDKNILYLNEDSGNVVFSCNEMGILNIDIYNINLDNNSDEDDPDTITLIRLLAGHINFEKHKALKKKVSEELMPIARHPKRWWNFCMSEDENQFLLSNAFNIYSIEELGFLSPKDL